MECPVDGTVLAMSERQGIEIDYCPSCRGVWLDRGELDKLIERADRDDDDDDDDRFRRDRFDGPDRDRDRWQGGNPPVRPKKKKSFFSEMFESFGGD